MGEALLAKLIASKLITSLAKCPSTTSNLAQKSLAGKYAAAGKREFVLPEFSCPALLCRATHEFPSAHPPGGSFKIC